MNENLRLSPAGAALIQAFEGCMKAAGKGRFKAYRCPANVPTIGWGHTNAHGAKFDMGDVWTTAQCDAAFLEDMEGFEAAVKRLVRVPLEQHEFDALMAFTYNCGAGALAKSTILKKLNSGDREGAARAFAAWNKAGGKIMPGLVRRRASEALLFQGVPDADYDGKPDRGRARKEPAEPMPQAVDAPEPPKGMATSKTGNTAIAIGTGGALETARQVNEVAKEVADAKDSAGSVLDMLTVLMAKPGFWVALVILAGAAFIWWDRRRKLTEDHV